MKNDTSMRLSVVIVSYNRLDMLEKHVRGYLNNDHFREYEIIVVDNGSSDGSRQLLESLSAVHSQLRVIQLERNIGMAAGANAGYRLAVGEVILSLDEDAWFDPRHWSAALETFDEVSDLGVLAPRVIHGETGQEQGVKLEPLSEIANYHGAGHFIRRSCLARVDFLDEGCFFGGEEIDLSMRLKDQGFRTLNAPEFCVEHYNFTRSGDEGLERRLKWAYGYGRVFAKNLTAPYAVLLLSRRWISSVRTVRRTERLSFAWKSAIAMIKGYSDGFRVRKVLSAEALAFYRSRHIVPEFGNVSLTSKLRDRSK